MGIGSAIARLKEPKVTFELKHPGSRRTVIIRKRRPVDGIMRFKKSRQSIILDGSLADNGGSWFTLDMSKGIQVGYRLGAVMVPVPVKDEHGNTEKIPGETGGGKDALPAVDHEVLETVEVREWVGIDGRKTYENENDLSYRQAANANREDANEIYKRVGIFALIIFAGLIVAVVVLAGKVHL